MRVLVGLAISSVMATVLAAAPVQLSSRAVSMLKPLMVLRNQQMTDEFTPDGRWRGESPVAPEIERRFYEILADRSLAGDEAVAYLVTVYMGEHFMEEVDCEATNRGRRILPMLEAFRRDKPRVGAEPLNKFVQGQPYFGEDVVKAIKLGQKCEWDET